MHSVRLGHLGRANTAQSVQGARSRRKQGKSMTSSGGDSSASPPEVRELAKITIHSDTRDVLAHAAKAASKLADYFIVDIDAHITETAFWSDITDRIDNDY